MAKKQTDSPTAAVSGSFEAGAAVGLDSLSNDEYVDGLRGRLLNPEQIALVELMLGDMKEFRSRILWLENISLEAARLRHDTAEWRDLGRPNEKCLAAARPFAWRTDWLERRREMDQEYPRRKEQDNGEEAD